MAGDSGQRAAVAASLLLLGWLAAGLGGPAVVH
jgi:hypothetical protein